MFQPSLCTAICVSREAPASVHDEARRVAAMFLRQFGMRLELTHAVAPASEEVWLQLAALPSPEHYELDLTVAGATLKAGGAAGLFYATQTFAQLLRQTTAGVLPAMRVEDGPDYAVRGFYHDVSRGKVPTRDTLCALVEKLAYYKINQLQLYLEHTFAFRNHPDVWAGTDPLTADDVRAVDEHAARHHIDLVPSLSTFGHFYTALASPRKHGLNELPIDASQLPFSWWDRMGHYTLDCRNPAAFELVREMILELRPLFRSRFFNLCCDETFDLGEGRNAAFAAKHGTGRLYVDFLKKLIRVVRSAGATPMFWGDIIGNHPELVRELPRDIVALDWDYSPGLKDTKSRLFRQAGVPFYVCPGVRGWDRWLNELDAATSNIIAFAQRGRRDGATGFLNTDWGDRGHINCLGNSFHGLALGAAAAWNGNAKPDDFNAAFSFLELGDRTGKSVALLHEAARLDVVSWRSLTLWLDPSPHRPAAWWDERTDVPVELLQIEPHLAFAAAKKLGRLGGQLARQLARRAPADPLVAQEILLGCRGSMLMNALGGWIVLLVRGRKPPQGAPAALEVANEVRRFESEFASVWHARNRPSEYWRLRTTLLELARRLELAALRGVWVKTSRTPAPSAAS